MTTLQERLAGKSESSLRGISLLLIAFFIFTVQDAIVKLLSSDYALFQIVLIRTLFVIPIVFIILHFDGGLPTLKTTQLRQHIWRGGMMFLAYAFFFMGLAALPYGLSIAIFFAGPLFITALSAPMLGETVGWQRWLAVLVGFVGVLIMMRPTGSSFEPATLFMVLSALCYAISIIITRKIQDNATSITSYTTAVYFVGALIASPIFANITLNTTHPSFVFLTQRWPLPPLGDLLLIFGLAVCWGVGMVLLSAAYRGTAVATLAPFEYFSIFYAVVLGYLLWGEIPSLAMLIGILLIVGSGLFIIYRENQLRRHS
ncbi:MAG: DMT family transporter [Chloroflexota bacterium]